MLTDYFHSLRAWKQQYAPKQPEDEWHPLFVEALQRESYIEYEEHEDTIKLRKASKRAFDKLLPSDTSGKTAGSHKKQLPSLKVFRAECAELLAMKKAAYPEYYKAKDEYRELLTYQANLAGLFGIENVRSAPQREHQQEEK